MEDVGPGYLFRIGARIFYFLAKGLGGCVPFGGHSLAKTYRRFFFKRGLEGAHLGRPFWGGKNLTLKALKKAWGLWRGFGGFFNWGLYESGEDV